MFGSEMQFGIRVGGVAWPWRDRAGFALAMVREPDPTKPGRDRYRVLAEIAAADVEAIYRWCLKQRSKFAVLDWRTDLERPARRLFDAANEARVTSGQWGIDLASGPLVGRSGELESYLVAIQDKTRAEAKVLIFGGSSCLPGILRSFPPDDMGRPPEEFPPLAALGYALSAAMLADMGKPGAAGQAYGGWGGWT